MSPEQNPQDPDEQDLSRESGVADAGGHDHGDHRHGEHRHGEHHGHDHPDEHVHDHHWLTVFMNAEPKEIDDRELTYDDVLMVEYNGHPPTGEHVYIQVSYSRGPEENPTGTLRPGESVKTKEGMAFRVRATDRS